MKKVLQDHFFIRNTRIRNRICVPPMVCYHWTDDSGIVSDRHVEHYRAMARGGAGLIIQEATCITQEGRLADSQLGIWDKSYLCSRHEDVNTNDYVLDIIHRHCSG